MNKLKDIAIISSGTFLKPAPDGEVKYLQSKHFSRDGNYLNLAFDELLLTNKSRKHLLKDGDILFSSKGMVNFAAVYKESMGFAIASSTFSVIKLRTNDFLPEYIKWYLNHPSTLASIRSKAMGTSVLLVTLAQLNEIEIPCVSISEQKIIVAMDSLFRQEKGIMQRLLELKQKQINYLLLNKIKK